MVSRVIAAVGWPRFVARHPAAAGVPEDKRDPWVEAVAGDRGKRFRVLGFRKLWAGGENGQNCDDMLEWVGFRAFRRTMREACGAQGGFRKPFLATRSPGKLP